MAIKIKAIAPSSSCTSAKDLLAEAEVRLKKEGVILSYNPNILSGDELPYFADNEEFRKNDLIEALTSNEYNIIWAFRGGYGSANLLKYCSNLNVSNKILIGFSDITALHILFNQHYGLASIHGEVITSWLKNQKSFKEYFKPLFSPTANVTYNLEPLANVNQNHQIISTLTGGNLTVLTTLIGTKFHPDFNNKIMFLEDVSEKPYAIHRHLSHMLSCGMFNKIAAVVFGEFTDSLHDPWPTIMNFCNNLPKNVASFRIRNVGHVNENLPLAFGTKVIIHNNNLSIEEFPHIN